MLLTNSVFQTFASLGECTEPLYFADHNALVIKLMYLVAHVCEGNEEICVSCKLTADRFIPYWFVFLSQYRGNNFIYDLQMPIMASGVSLTSLAILFYIGESFHLTVMEVSHAIYRLEWYRYPRNVQRLLILMILRAQEPFYLSAFDIVEVNLRNFLGVSELNRLPTLLRPTIQTW